MVQLLFESLWEVPVHELDAQGLANRFMLVEHGRRRAEAELAELMLEVDRREVFRDDMHASVKGWCRASAKWSTTETDKRVRVAKLFAAIPDVAEALALGMLGVAQCEEMARAFANPRCGNEMAQMVPIFLQHAENMPFESFRKMVLHWEHNADADGAHRSHVASHHNRRASVHAEEFSIHLNAAGGTLQGAEMMDIFEQYQQAEFAADWQHARAEFGDLANPSHLVRTAAQRAFDALHRIFIDAASTPPGSDPPEPVLNIVIDITTFEGLIEGLTGTDRQADPSPGAQPTPPPPDPRRWYCNTTSGVPVPRAAVLHAALIGHVRRVVIDSAGVVVDLGRKRRLFTGPLRDAVMMLSDGCIWPGCEHPARRCQADHTIDHQHGGTTSADNGAPACGRHNRGKNRGYAVWRDQRGYWHTYRPDGTEIR